MRTVLICHREDAIDRDGLARWLASFSDLAGVVVIEEPRSRRIKRVRREITRVGPIRFLDVLAFRLYYRVALARSDARWRAETLQALERRFAPLPPATPVHATASPNSAETEAFLRELAPDVVIARCKVLLKESVFSIARTGTFVLHPGICPEYRNAHGCFWALAEGDVDRVGLTLLRIDRGVDTGPIFGHYRYAYDDRDESHVVIQYRVLLENLDTVAERLREIHRGEAEPIDTLGRASRAWGQPWLTRYIRWKRRARNRPRARARPDPLATETSRDG